MDKKKQLAAVELLMNHPEQVVAEMLGIRLSTLKRWILKPEFAEALREREREQNASARRIARQAVVNSATALCQAVSGSTKPDTKVLLDVLKVSGAFEEQEEDPGAALAELIKIAQMPENQENG